ncbi:MAG TPA: hypothetical protein VFT22_38050, partial [Kofleriaceae bacterium]|nr:hypothetical protein [Kofleriaceae bacterium]
RARVYTIDRSTGAVSVFDSGFAGAYGIEWLATSSTQFANSLLVAAFDDRVVSSTQGAGKLAAAYLRNSPVDLALVTGTLYIVTAAGQGNRGRIYKVGGF